MHKRAIQSMDLMVKLIRKIQKNNKIASDESRACPGVQKIYFSQSIIIISCVSNNTHHSTELCVPSRNQHSVHGGAMKDASFFV